MAQEGKPALVADTDLDKRFNPTWTANPPKSLVATPIKVDQKVYGVISAEQDRRNGFNEQDQLLLDTLALQASQAINIAQARTRLEALNSTGGYIINSQMDIDHIFKILLETVDVTFNCLYSTLFILEPTDELVVKARTVHSRKVDRIRFKKGEGLVGPVAQQGKSQIVADAA